MRRCAPAALPQPPAFDRARAALRYDGNSSRLILGFKRGGRLDGVTLFARWMAQAGEELLADTDLIVPVPLHRWRLLRRGFNQSAVLAQRIAGLVRAALGAGASCSAIARPRRSRASARRRACRTSPPRAFRVARPERVAGARVLLVDDVQTTGATLAACASVLRRAGAERVDVLALARVVRDEALPI